MSKIYGDTVGGGGVNLKKIPQSDWNQTDETQCDYIKNKPDLTRVVTTGTNHNINKPTQPTPELIYEQKEDGTYKCTGISDSFEGDTILVADWYNDHYVTEVDAIFNQTVFIPSHVTRVNIGNSKAVIFDESSRLVDFTITDAHLETLVLPTSLKNIKDNIFLNCVPTSLVFKGIPDSIGAVLSNKEGCKDIYVPWAETDAINVNAPWGFTEATIHYNFPVEVFNMDGTWKTLDDYIGSYTNGDTAKVIKNMKRIDEEGLAKGWYDANALEKFQNQFNRVYVEQSRNRGIYAKVALTASGKLSSQPKDYDIDDQEIPYYLGSIPTRLPGSEQDPDFDDTDTRYRVGHIKVPPVDVDNFPTADEAKEFATSKLYVDSAIDKSKTELENVLLSNNNSVRNYKCKSLHSGVISGCKITSTKTAVLHINPKYNYTGSLGDHFFKFDSLFKYSSNVGDIYFAMQDTTLRGYIYLNTRTGRIYSKSGINFISASSILPKDTWVHISIYGRLGGNTYLDIDGNKYNIGVAYPIPDENTHLKFIISLSQSFSGNVALSNIKYDVGTDSKISSEGYEGTYINLIDGELSTSTSDTLYVKSDEGFWMADINDKQAISKFAVNNSTLDNYFDAEHNYYTKLENNIVLESNSKYNVYSPIYFKPNLRDADTDGNYIAEFKCDIYREDILSKGQLQIFFANGNVYPIYIVIDYATTGINKIKMVADKTVVVASDHSDLGSLLPINKWSSIELSLLTSSDRTEAVFKVNGELVLYADSKTNSNLPIFGSNIVEYPILFAPSKSIEVKLKLRNISYWSTLTELLPETRYCYQLDNLYIDGEAISTSTNNSIYQSGGLWYARSLIEDTAVVNKKYVETKIINYSPLAGKKIAYHGDSICESRTDASKLNYNGGGYAKIIADITGSTYDNKAGSGSVLVSALPSGQSLSNDTTAKYIVTDMDSMPDDADIICFQGGINDWSKGCPFGELSAENDYSGTLDTKTVIGALETICRKAINKWSGKPICFIITHKIANGNSAYAKCSGTDPWSYKELHDVMIQIFNKYSIPYLDMFNEGGLNSYMDIHNTLYFTGGSLGTPDKTHPNEEAYRKYYVPKLIELFESLV